MAVSVQMFCVQMHAMHVISAHAVPVLSNFLALVEPFLGFPELLDRGVRIRTRGLLLSLLFVEKHCARMGTPTRVSALCAVAELWAFGREMIVNCLC